MRKLQNTYFALLLMGSLTVTASSCKKNEEAEPKEVQGSISAMKIEFTAKGQNTAPITATYSDLHESDNVPGVVTGSLNLDPGTTYNVKIALVDTRQDPAIDVSSKVKKTQDYHEFFYIAKDGLVLDVVKSDRDANGLTVGFTGETTTSETPSSGELQIVLKHLRKDGVIIKTSASDAKTGPTDFSATFPIVIE